VLRRELFLDRLIDTLSAGKKLDVEVRISLRIGLYQLIDLSRIPEHSAVDESVSLVVRAKKTSARGFVNAILRRFIRETPKIGFTDVTDRIAIGTSHPRWLIEKWTRDLCFESAAVIAAANNRIPQTAFRVLRDGEEIQELIADSMASEYISDCWIIKKQDPRIQKLAAAGAIYLQDEGSQIIGNAVELGKSDSFLDVCAAPGGKTGLVARKFADARLVVGGDLYGKRVEHLRDNCERQSPGVVSIVQYDAVSALPFADRSFDCVLVDAPCSGTGTIRHNPELRYFLNEADFEELQEKQLAILENASKLVVLGGEVFYSTCSIEPEENEHVADMFLARNPDFSPVPLNISASLITERGFARTWPHRDGMDGFFVASFRRERSRVE
jgi:16S rRNA (cytosine967-C5)-methyltransferase